jgi:hypothetical protein
MLFHCCGELLLNLGVLELTYFSTDVWPHPGILGIAPVDHVMLSLF